VLGSDPEQVWNMQRREKRFLALPGIEALILTLSPLLFIYYIDLSGLVYQQF